MKNSKNTTVLTNVEDLEKKREENFESLNDTDITELTEGDDAIEIEGLEGDKITFGSSFSAADGDLGDESEDNKDLPDALKEQNHYDPSLSMTDKASMETDLDEQGMHIADEDEIGMGYDENDYTEGR